MSNHLQTTYPTLGSAARALGSATRGTNASSGARRAGNRRARRVGNRQWQQKFGVHGQTTRPHIQHD